MSDVASPVWDEDRCDRRTAQRIAASLDLDPAGLREGDPLPNGWQFAFFTTLARRSELGVDGYVVPPALPDLALPGDGVMLGGRRATYYRALPIGALLRRGRTMAGVARKASRSGPIAIVTWRNAIHIADEGEPAIVEDEDMIYRTAKAASAPEGDRNPTPVVSDTPVVAADATVVFTPRADDLFRYSALSFNAHRIHYDALYARETEGFAGLVVNGGLTALRLLQLYRDTTGREAMTVATRNAAPLWCDEPVDLHAARREGDWRLWATGPDGRLASEAIVT